MYIRVYPRIYSLSVAVSYVELNNMTVVLNGDRAISLSGYNSTIVNISVSGNGCGGISMSGGDQVSIFALLSHVRI